MKTIESIYTGGTVLITADESLLISTVNEDVEVIELDSGKQVHKLEGVKYQLNGLGGIVVLLGHVSQTSLGYRTCHNDGSQA